MIPMVPDPEQLEWEAFEHDTMALEDDLEGRPVMAEANRARARALYRRATYLRRLRTPGAS